MRKYSLLRRTTFIAFTILLLANLTMAQYWFQSGARATSAAGFNNGAGVSIKTVYQDAANGSLGFWVGEDLSNGAFIQAGYEITNSTGYYSSSCGNDTKGVYLTAGVPTWFWEYFPVGADNNTFCGGIGPDGSAGKNGSFNTYSFISSGEMWNVYFDGQKIGSVNLGTSNSGPNPPSAIAEYAETNSNKWTINKVEFKNLLFYIGNSSRSVQEALSTIGYGKGSETYLPNNYGVQEVGNFVNDFAVGSGIPANQKSSVLWQLGYSLSVNSDYGNATGSGNYLAYSIVQIAAPQIVNISNGVREVFAGWSGYGSGSYTGNDTSAYVTLYQNTTETANWRRQYYLNATTQYGKVSGSGWYYANATVKSSINANIIGIAPGSRVVFAGWSNGNSSNATKVFLNGPKTLAALWKNQYYLNVTSQYSKANGSGWYDANSTASVYISNTVMPINQTSRYGFYGWSNGNLNRSFSIELLSPIAISAIFQRQFLIELAPQNSYGENLGNVSSYLVSGAIINSSGKMFAFQNRTYNVQSILYKNINITTNYMFSIASPAVINFKTPIYNIEINTQSVFGTPVNASLNITFKNNTDLETYTGSNGLEIFRNVPYGYVSGYAEYFGIRESINAINGYGAYLTFLTASLFVYIILGIALVVAVAMITSRHQQRRAAK